MQGSRFQYGRFVRVLVAKAGLGDLGKAKLNTSIPVLPGILGGGYFLTKPPCELAPDGGSFVEVKVEDVANGLNVEPFEA